MAQPDLIIVKVVRGRDLDGAGAEGCVHVLVRDDRDAPPQERQQLRDRYQAFSQLPPEQQTHARELFRQFNSLPEDRRPIVRREYEQLRSMPEAERNERMNSEAFRSRFNPAEQQMLQDLSRTFGKAP